MVSVCVSLPTNGAYLCIYLFAIVCVCVKYLFTLFAYVLIGLLVLLLSDKSFNIGCGSASHIRVHEHPKSQDWREVEVI